VTDRLDHRLEPKSKHHSSTSPSVASKEEALLGGPVVDALAVDVTGLALFDQIQIVQRAGGRGINPWPHSWGSSGRTPLAANSSRNPKAVRSSTRSG